MSTRKDELDRLQVASPCSASWERMSGDEQQRYCDECQRFVYDFSKMTRRQIEAMIATSRGRICARLTRQADGSLMTMEAPPVTYPANRRISSVANIVMTALLSVNAAGAPQSLMSLLPSPSAYAEQDAQQDPKKTDAKARIGEVTATLLGNVFDPAGAAISGVRVLLSNERKEEPRVALSSAQGEYRFPQLPPGAYTLTLESPGFVMTKVAEINLQAGQEQRTDVTMQIDAKNIVMGGMIAIRVPSLRELYQESELAVVATVGDSFLAETEGTRKLMKTWLYVSSTLKEEWPAPALPFYHWVMADEPDEFARGDKLLVFLNQRRADDKKESLDGYEADAGSFGIKKLPEDVLNAYLRRLGELRELLRQEKPDRAEMLEWLVRCAEDPATRGDGTSELTRRIEDLCELGAKGECEGNGRKIDDAVKAALQLNQQKDNAQAKDSTDADTDDDDEVEVDDVKIAALLSKEQQERLLTALYKTDELKGRDRGLIELAVSWKDARLVPFLLAQLRHVESAPPPFAEDVITAIVDVLKDKEIEDLAKNYRDQAQYDDLDERDGQQSADEKKAAAEAAATAMAVRSALLRKFVFAVQNKINLPALVR